MNTISCPVCATLLNVPANLHEEQAIQCGACLHVFIPQRQSNAEQAPVRAAELEGWNIETGQATPAFWLPKVSTVHEFRQHFSERHARPMHWRAPSLPEHPTTPQARLKVRDWQANSAQSLLATPLNWRLPALLERTPAWTIAPESSPQLPVARANTSPFVFQVLDEKQALPANPTFVFTMITEARPAERPIEVHHVQESPHYWTLASMIALVVLIMQLFYLVLLP